MEKNEVRLTRIEIESFYQCPIDKDIVIDYMYITGHNISIGMKIKTDRFEEDSVDKKRGAVVANVMTDWYVDTFHPDTPDGTLDFVEIGRNITTDSKLVAMVQSMVGIMYNNTVQFK